MEASLSSQSLEKRVAHGANLHLCRGLQRGGTCGPASVAVRGCPPFYSGSLLSTTCCKGGVKGVRAGRLFTAYLLDIEAMVVAEGVERGWSIGGKTGLGILFGVKLFDLEGIAAQESHE